VSRFAHLPRRICTLVLLGAGLAGPARGAQDGASPPGGVQTGPGQPAGTPDEVGQGQESADGWNSTAVLELVGRAREARTTLAMDGALTSYRASVEGHVYFYLDPEAGERILIRLDQVAVEVQWQAPDRFHQHIVGERSETRLPVQDFRYYLDRLTLVEYGFGDEIRIGGGLDVSGVPHPLAMPPGTDPQADLYDFRIADSLTLQLPGRPDPLRLHEVEVIPRDPGRPAALGRITLETGTASVVRMALTFTPASYVDRRTDRISVDVDYGLWQDRYWLPNQQRIEVRREVPEIDLGMGTVIRSVLRAGNYDLNVPLPEGFAGFPPVTAVSPVARREFAFREGLYDALERDGLAGILAELDPRELEAQAFALLGGRPPSGLSPVRLHLTRPSSLLHYSRAEGLVLGGGVSVRPAGRFAFRGTGAVSPGSGDIRAGSTLEFIPRTGTTIGMTGTYREIRDLGLAPASDALISTLGAVFRGEDYRDPWLATGGELHLGLTAGTGLRVGLSAGVERAESAALARPDAPAGGNREARPIRPITEGTFISGGIAFQSGFAMPRQGRGSGSAGIRVLSGRPGQGAELQARFEGRWGPPSRAREFRAVSIGTVWVGDPLLQGHRLLGGRGTLPGHPFRAYAGNRTLAATMEGSTDLGTPMVRLRGAVHGGWAAGGVADLAERWGTTGTGRPKIALSMGLGFGWDLLRAEIARGLGAGEWQLLLSTDPRWWDRL